MLSNLAFGTGARVLLFRPSSPSSTARRVSSPGCVFASLWRPRIHLVHSTRVMRPTAGSTGPSCFKARRRCPAIKAGQWPERFRPTHHHGAGLPASPVLAPCSSHDYTPPSLRNPGARNKPFSNPPIFGIKRGIFRAKFYNY